MTASDQGSEQVARLFLGGLAVFLTAAGQLALLVSPQGLGLGLLLTAMGVPRSDAAGHLRFSLGHSNSDAHIDRLLEVLPPLVSRLRELSPFANS